MLATAQQKTVPCSDTTDTAPFDELANLCKASGDQLRLQILRILQQESFGVTELSSIFAMRQPAMSHHLKVLANAGLITSRREGNSIYYRRASSRPLTSASKLHGSLLACVDQLPMPADLQERLQVLQCEREQSSQQFFRQNADKFRAQQDLIASYEQYADTVGEVLQDVVLPQRQLALEVGPGDGAFLERLSPVFERVVALDNSAEMLTKSRQLAQREELSNIDFICGDTRHLQLAQLQADCIVVNMVLHHTPSPADIFKDLARYLGPAGVLLVTDLCNHDQAWARESCGDLWLGFEPNDLKRWAEAAGLGEITSVYLAQRNGFQIQVRLFGHHSAHHLAH